MFHFIFFFDADPFFSIWVNYVKPRSLERRTTLHCGPSWHVLADVSEFNSPRALQFISLSCLLFYILLSLIFFTAWSALEMNNWKMARAAHGACSELLIQREALYVQSEKIISYSPIFFSSKWKDSLSASVPLSSGLPIKSTTPDLLRFLYFHVNKGTMAAAARRGGQQLGCKMHSSLMGECISIDSNECTNWG